MRRLLAVTALGLLLAGPWAEAQEQPVRLRKGIQAGEADVRPTAPTGAEEGIVTRPIPMVVNAVSAGNSSTALLIEDATFTGTYADVTAYAGIIVTIFADQASATDGVKFQWSTNGTNLDVEEVTTLPAAQGRAHNLSPRAQFFRVVYTNGSVAQGAFRLETTLFVPDTGIITRPLGKPIDDTYFAQLNRAVLAAKKPDQTYTNIAATAGGNLKVSLEEAEAGVQITAIGPLTDTELRANPVPVSGTVAATGPLTDTELRALPVPVSGTVTANQGAPLAAVTTSGTIDAVDETVTLALQGRYNGYVSVSGTFVGELAAEYSFDNASTWEIPVTLGGFPDGETMPATGPVSGPLSLYPQATHVRIRSIAWTSGAADVFLSAYPSAARTFFDSQVFDFSRAGGMMVQVGGIDPISVLAHALAMRNENPDTNDWGLVTRNIPSGTQNVNTIQFGGNNVATGTGGSGLGIPRVTVANDSTLGLVPVTAGGLSISRTVSAASTNATNIKASAGQVYAIIASNVNASPRFVHLYNTAGTPTCGSSIIATFIVPGATTGAGTNIPLNPGVAFATGIGICITANNDGTGNAAANDVVLSVAYK